jgi:ubiquinone/menaquinone biosynthesis C-methylase UbiE
MALFDAVLCSESNLHDIDSLIREMWRVVKTIGHYIVISHTPPERRLPHFGRNLPGINADVIRICKGFSKYSLFISD